MKAVTRRLFALGREGQWEQALDLLEDLPQQRLRMDAVMCSAMSAACESSRRWDVMLQLQDDLTLDVAACTALMKLYGRCSQWSRALEVFSKMLNHGPTPDTFALSAAIVACASWRHILGLLEDAWLSQRRPNLVVYNSAISSCSEWQVALALMEDLEKRDLEADPVTCGSLVAACEKASEWQRAIVLVVSSDLVNVVSASTAISACAKANEAAGAVALLKALPGMQIQPSAASFNAAGLGQNWDVALKLLQSAKLLGVKVNSKSLNAQMKAWEKGSCWQNVLTSLKRGDQQLGMAIRACHQACEWQRALALFADRRGKEPPPLELWNAAMANQDEEAWQQTLPLFEGLQEVLPPDVFSCNLVMKACETGRHWRGSLALLQIFHTYTDLLTYHMVMTTCMESWRWEEPLKLLQDLEDSSAQPGLVVYGPVVGACLRSLQWEHALLLVQSLWAKTLTPDTTMCNAVITVCERSGQWAWALQLWQKMGCSGPEPDTTTRNAVINACASGFCWEAALDLLHLDAGDEALGAALRACSLANCWRQALELPRRNLVADFAVLDACSRSAQWLQSAQLREETGESLVATSKGGDRESIMAAVTERLQDLDAFREQEVLAVSSFQTPVRRSLTALTRPAFRAAVSELAGETILRDAYLERQSSLGPFFVADFLLNIGSGPAQGWVEEARVRSRRIMEDRLPSEDPMAKDILAYTASTWTSRGRSQGYRAQCFGALPAVYVEHHRFPHAERQALLDLLRFLG